MWGKPFWTNVLFKISRWNISSVQTLFQLSFPTISFFESHSFPVQSAFSKSPFNHSSNTTHSWFLWGYGYSYGVMVPSFQWVAWERLQNTGVPPVLALLWQVLWQIIQGMGLHSLWDRQIENTSSIVCDPKDLGTDLMLRHCAVLWLGQRAARSCVEGQGNAWQFPGKDREEKSSTLSKLPQVCHWKAHPLHQYSS